MATPPLVLAGECVLPRTPRLSVRHEFKGTDHSTIRTIDNMVLNDTQFARNVRQDGGASRVAADRSEPTVHGGYFVSLPGHEKIVDHASAGTVARHREGILRDLAAPKYQGAWRQYGKTYLDASDHVTDRAQAILLGHVQKQKGIYDVDNDATMLMKDHPPKMPSRASLK